MKPFILFMILIVVFYSVPVFADTPPLTPEEAAQSIPVKAFDPNTSSPSAPQKLLSNPFESVGWTPWGSPLAEVGATDQQWQETSLVQGHAYYVSANATVTGDGTQANPWNSVKYAVAQLHAGDILYLAEGVYKESVNFSTSGRSDAWITVRGIGDVLFDGTGSTTLVPAFDTKGNDYLHIENIQTTKMRAAVEVSAGSDHVEIDGLKTDGNRFAVRINASTNVTVRNAYAVNSNNGFRAYGGSRNLVFENISTFGAKDIYDGMDPNYRNGDGFIFEADVSNVTMRNIVSGDNWDGGFDVKASNVLMENVVAFGNKNNLKIWGDNVEIRSALSFGAKRQVRDNGTTVEGNGITVERGGTVKLVNVTLADNEDHDIEIYEDGVLRLENSIVARRDSRGLLFENKLGLFTSENVLWFNSASAKPLPPMSTEDFWADPKFVNPTGMDYRLQAGSPAIDRAGVSSGTSRYDVAGDPRIFGEQADLGAYEFQGNGDPQPVPVPDPAPQPDPAPVPDPTPSPAPNPKPAESAEPLVLNVTSGQTVSGIMVVQPASATFNTLKGVQYFIDGKKISKALRAPFILGGRGFDTKKLTNGKHTIVALYTSGKEEKVVSVDINVFNLKGGKLK